jgi:hypothetical protein
VNGRQGDGDENQQDQQGEVDDGQDVREGNAISAHGFEGSGVCRSLQLKSAVYAGATMAP